MIMRMRSRQSWSSHLRLLWILPVMHHGSVPWTRIAGCEPVERYGSCSVHMGTISGDIRGAFSSQFQAFTNEHRYPFSLVVVICCCYNAISRAVVMAWTMSHIGYLSSLRCVVESMFMVPLSTGGKLCVNTWVDFGDVDHRMGKHMTPILSCVPSMYVNCIFIAAF